MQDLQTHHQPPSKERCSRVLRKPLELIVIVVTLLSYGCPIQAIVHAYGLDERTVADWRDRAGRHWKPRSSGHY
jgi:transposase-like protein